jgi:hypothetical protein
MIPPLDLDDEFDGFMRKANPTVPQHSAQWQESRRVWYAGVALLFYHLLTLTTYSDDVSARELEQIKQQLLAFKKRVTEDKA